MKTAFYKIFFFLILIQDPIFTHEVFINLQNLEVERLSFKNGVYKYNTNINLTIHSEKKLSHDFDEIRCMTVEFLRNYTYTPAMWELVNKELVIYLKEAVPEINSLSSRIKVDASSKRPFDRWTLAYLDKNENVHESFGFEFTLNNVAKEKANLAVWFKYKEVISASDYVNFELIKDEIDNYFQYQDFSDENLYICSQKILQNYPIFSSFSISQKSKEI